ncbi:hypothetical protein ACJX0J_008805, partial [Zea mays]
EVLRKKEGRGAWLTRNGRQDTAEGSLQLSDSFRDFSGQGISAALLSVMGSRFKKSGKVFPAGVVSLVSLVMGRDIPIVHRVIKVHERHDTVDSDILTKGDNNPGDDRVLYLPYAGWLTIVMTEKPVLK